MALLRSKGKLTFLRVHDVGTRWGPPDDSIDAEVIFKIDRLPSNAFGFQLRDDASRPVRQGMLDLLRDAFNHAWDLEVVYELAEGKSNGLARRVWVTRSPTETRGPRGPVIARPVAADDPDADG